jgi:hypothetical protein
MQEDIRKKVHMNKELLLPIGQEAGWVPELTWMMYRSEISLAPVRFLCCPAHSLADIMIELCTAEVHTSTSTYHECHS